MNNKIVDFLSSYEGDIEFENHQITDEIERVRKQIDELNSKIQKLEAAKDVSYEVFSASQAGNNHDAEIDAMKVLISEKEAYLNNLQAQLSDKEQQLAEVQDLDYHSVNDRLVSDEDLVKRLRRVYKWIPVDAHRAQSEIQQIIKLLQKK